MGRAGLDLWARTRASEDSEFYWVRVLSYKKRILPSRRITGAGRRYVSRLEPAPTPPFWNYEIHDCWVANGEGREFV